MAASDRTHPAQTDCAPQGGFAPRRAHLIGIAGSGMRALAEVLLANDWRLSGSDPAIDTLSEADYAGLRRHRSHAAENVPADAELVVYSDAVPADNPERRKAAELGIPALSYFEMLGRLTADRRVLAVAGTHGKSSTTAMAAGVLSAAGRDPTVLCGAAPLGQSSGGRAGSGDAVLVEACEYRANFLHLQPHHALILGVEPDHFDCYDSPEQLEDAFARFAGKIAADGLLLTRHDCPVARRIAQGLPCRVETFGIDEQTDWSARWLFARSGRYSFEIHHRGPFVCNVSLKVPGRHNVLNALAAAALAGSQGVDGEGIGRALSKFRGLHRRLESRGTHRGVALLDDYAHHPTEVTAALAAVRRMHPVGRVWCVFQPHQASRTARLLDELAASLQNADKVLVADIFRAREGAPKSGEVSAADLARAVRRGGTDVGDAHDPRQIARLVQDSLRPGDVLITMGAGDIGRICDGFIDGIREDRAAG